MEKGSGIFFQKNKNEIVGKMIKTQMKTRKQNLNHSKKLNGDIDYKKC